MIGRLTGTLTEKNPPMLLVDVNGVGYEVQAPMSTIFQLPALKSPVTLFTHLIVSEHAQYLCGFLSDDERRLFRTLIKVNGVGPKLALTILSGISVEEFARCVHEDDTKTLVKLPGVGKKTAERLIIEVRDKLQDWVTGTLPATNPNAAMLNMSDASSEAVSALIALGYKPQQAGKMVQQAERGQAGGTGSSEDLIRAALKAVVS